MVVEMPTGYSEEELNERISHELQHKNFTFRVDAKSLDARKRSNIHWLLQVIVISPTLDGPDPLPVRSLLIPFRKRNKRILVTGSGPAGFFAAFILQKAGYETVIIERGAGLEKRAEGITNFERAGEFSPVANYSFGEGGAGTFSDGKLTSRSKHISVERDFIVRSYMEAGAPEEISYLAHPHLGSDNLKAIVKNLRIKYQEIGGEIRFETMLTDIIVRESRVMEAVTDSGMFPADEFIIAPGHSSYETYRLLIRKGVPFRTKGFALGCRAEHRQADINKAQWGVQELPGVKAAEYRLTSPADGRHPVYTFCMCPGGIIVPAATHRHVNIVNGMSYYRRDGTFSNAACVVGVHSDELAGRKVAPLEALEWLENLERSFFEFSNSYHAPFCGISDFLNRKMPGTIPASSYPLGIIPAPLWDLLPPAVTLSLEKGLSDFTRRIRGYDQGILMGLESKTSSPVQVIRGKDGLCDGFRNLYLAGEGSGYSGGIISSAADGIKIAMNIIGKDH